jgi:hypothetical protein
MKDLSRKLAAVAVAATVFLGVSAPADAVVATSIIIRSGIAGGDWLQIGELQVYAGGVNVALASNGATVFSGGWYDASSMPIKAIDGNTSSSYPNIYHSDGAGPTEYLEVKFTGAFDVSDIVLYARSDCCTARNLFSYQLRNLGQYGSMLVAEGTLDARIGSYAALAQLPISGEYFGVPEPGTWAMMLGGFGLAGLAMRRRAARIAFV